jgi:hypothetical protein
MQNYFANRYEILKRKLLVHSAPASEPQLSWKKFGTNFDDFSNCSISSLPIWEKTMLDHQY